MYIKSRTRLVASDPVYQEQTTHMSFWFRVLRITRLKGWQEAKKMLDPDEPLPQAIKDWLKKNNIEE